jgi:autotransporter passenger strand-loop-strand repeat protein
MKFLNQFINVKYKITALLALFLIFNTSVCCNIYGRCTKEVKGIVKNEVVNDGDIQIIFEGGCAINTTINKGGKQVIHSNGVAKNTKINRNGVQTVYEGGCAINTKINRGGVQGVKGGVAKNAKVNKGYQLVFKKGKAEDTTVKGRYGQQIVYDNGYVSKTVLSKGSLQRVANATAEDTIINKSSC